MSKLGKLFKGGGPGRPKGRAGPTPQEALARLRETEEMLAKKQEYLETRIERELAAAKQHGTRNKRGEPSPRPPSQGLPPWLAPREETPTPTGGPAKAAAGHLLGAVLQVLGSWR